MNNFLHNICDSELFIENFIYEYNIFLPPFPSLAPLPLSPPNFMSSSFLKLSDAWVYDHLLQYEEPSGTISLKKTYSPSPAASVRRGISWAPPSPMLGGIFVWLHLGCTFLVHVISTTASRVGKGPVVSLQMSTASGSCLLPPPPGLSLSLRG